MPLRGKGNRTASHTDILRPTHPLDSGHSSPLPLGGFGSSYIGHMKRRPAQLPLHTGNAPPWLFQQMTELAGAVTTVTTRPTT